MKNINLKRFVMCAAAVLLCFFLMGAAPFGIYPDVMFSNFNPLWLILFLPFTVLLARTQVLFYTKIDEKPYRVYLWRGQKAETPQSIMKAGNKLNGWYMASIASDDSKWDFENSVFIRKKLYADWIPHDDFIS